MKPDNPAGRPKNVPNPISWEESELQIAEFERDRAGLREEIKRERKALDALIDEAEGWQQAKTIRAYLAAVKTHATREGTIDDDAKWIAWAYDQADRLDPLSPTPPSVLDTPRDQYRELGMNEYLDEEGSIRQA